MSKIMMRTLDLELTFCGEAVESFDFLNDRISL